ncbi:hypothetical protein IE81DRAFT_332007, partial [Ceraceosorus guamensis]
MSLTFSSSASSPVASSNIALYSSVTPEQPQCPRTRHILSGTFNTPHLHLLRFDTLTRALTLVHQISSSSSSSSSVSPSFSSSTATSPHAHIPEGAIQAKGPHQFLALGKSIGSVGTCDAYAGPGPSTRIEAQQSRPNRVYATTWALKPELSAWEIRWDGKAQSESERRGMDAGFGAADPLVHFINSVPITATSSYVSVQPPPFYSLTSPSYAHAECGASSRYLYSAGGPSGEVHKLNEDGSIASKVQEVVFLAEGQEGLVSADKTRKALRYGAHSVDFSPDSTRAYVADLGRNSILVYSVNPNTGMLDEVVDEVRAFDEGDGPRHVIPSPDGKWIASVTEH